MFIDRATIHVSGGRGGEGALSFRREAYVPKGGPDGGDGGHGGGVYLVSTSGVDTLLDMAGRHHWRAEAGQPGRGKSQHGRGGGDLRIPVPPGTLVYDQWTGELLDDLDAPGRVLLAARGGRGGFGNEHFKGPTNQTPRHHTPGEKGERRTLRLELKLIAEVGLIGKPNAGKSTLLARLSAARPRVADYPFTTLDPKLGIAELSGHRRLVLADIPGLIAGAHRGQGLGHDFLRHVERTRMLVHVIEMEPSDGSDPIENYHLIRGELRAYAPELAAKDEVIAVNKMDLLGEEEDHRVAVDLIEERLGRAVLPISAATGLGCGELLETCWRGLHADPRNPAIRG